ncbi:MAG: hypothetical protein M1136_08860 [Chloroflexi bacterium]|nr:hypothetical protein [Chloroflexota bacterium]
MPECSCNIFPANLGNVIFGAKVGIGTESPGARLHTYEVYGTGDTTLREQIIIERDSYTYQGAGAGAGGSILFKNRDYNGGSIEAGEIGVINTNNVQGDVKPALVFLLGQGTPSEKVRITTDGNVGIGTTGPEAKLHVEGSVNPSILVKQTTPAKRAYYEVNSAGQLLSTDGDIQFQTNGGGWSIKMVLTNAGDVGIGTSPGEKLEVAGNIKLSGSLFTGTRRVADSGGCYYAD